MRRLGILLALLLAVAAIGYAAFSLSPWPAVMLIRHTFDADSDARNKALALLRPAGISEIRDQRYGPAPANRLDIYRPANLVAGRALVVWTHGGGFVAGQKEELAGYLRILAGRGHVIVAVEYSIAPGATYPTPVIEVNEALGFLSRNASSLGIDPQRIILIGDSAGAQISSQLAAAISDPEYARTIGFTPSIGRERLAGIALFCGVYDGENLNQEGPFGGFIRTVLWAYFGRKDVSKDPRLAEFAVPRHVNANFPPTFLSVGNADPLVPQTMLLDAALRGKGVAVETLYFPKDHSPELEHEYQFRLELEAGKLALERLDAFLISKAR